MDKKEIAEVLETILDGLNKGEEIKKEKQFYETVIRFCLMDKYLSLKNYNRFAPFNGADVFFQQSKAVTQPVSELDPNFDFNRFVDEYLTAARNDTLIGIKEEE